MKFYIPDDLKKGVEIIADKYFSEKNISVKAVQSEKIGVELKNSEATIFYDKKITFFREFGIFAEKIRTENNFFVYEERQFENCGVMLDLSRNGVMKVESVKRYIEYMAIMGLNMLQLYMEDVYTVENEPYFGYMRGRYSKSELKEIDDYADIFGVEVIPCIQTLGHMEQFLRWDTKWEFTDTDNTLIADSEKTYTLLSDMIKSVSECFRTKRIHIGMDEASGSGLGLYLTKHGYTKPMEIYLRHINRVNDIAKECGIKPMIWSDMFFKHSSKTHSYYDKTIEFTKGTLKKIPEGLQLVYWDYYHVTEDAYYTFAKMHKDIDNNAIFAGGIWLWAGMVPDYHFTFLSTKSALSAIKKAGISECFATIWEDDGCETNQFASLLGMQLYAENAYNENVSDEYLKKRYEFCVGSSYDAIFTVADLHYKKEERLSEATDDRRIYHTLKSYLWQDVLTGMADYELINNPMSGYYYEKSELLKKYSLEENDALKFFFEYSHSLSKVLALKCSISERLSKEYKKGNTEYLKECVYLLLPQLKKDVNALMEYHKKLWFNDYKAFGWEVLALRYGGLKQRIEDSILRIKQYLNGDISEIEELKEERLPFIAKGRNTYKQISKTTVSTHL